MMDRSTFEFKEEDLQISLGPEDYIYKLPENKRSELSLGLGLTDQCNLQCPMCYYRENKKKITSSSISIPKLKTILSNLGPVGSIVIGLEGEPLCHKNFSDIVQLCSSYTTNISIISNGLLLTKDLLNLFNKCNVKNIVLSCDGSDKQYYEKIRFGGNFSVFCKKALMASSLFQGQVSIHSVISNQNINDIHNMPHLASKLGINKISFAQLRQNSWSKKNSFYRASFDQLKIAIEQLVERAQENNTELTFDALFASGELYKWMESKFSKKNFIKINHMDSCFFPWNFTSILSDGRLFPCCGDINPVNMEKSNFDSIFNNEILLKFRKALHTEIPPVCKECLGLSKNS